MLLALIRPVHIPTAFELLGTWALIALLLGSIPFGLIVSWIYTKGTIDIRKVGSGNIGMTNVWRTLGWKAGLSVFILDVLKGFYPVIRASQDCMTAQGPYVAPWRPENPVILGLQSQEFYGWVPLLVGLVAVLAHTFTPWLKFRGGKGVATGLGVALALYGWWSFLPLFVFGIVLIVSRMVSLSSLIAALSLAMIGFVIGPPLNDYNMPPESPWPMWPFGLVAFLLVLYTHRSNIKRILNGTENKVNFGRKRDVPLPQTLDP